MRGIMYILFNCMISGLDCCFFVIVVEVSFFFYGFYKFMLWLIWSCTAGFWSIRCEASWISPIWVRLPGDVGWSWWFLCQRNTWKNKDYGMFNILIMGALEQAFYFTWQITWYKCTNARIPGPHIIYIIIPKLSVWSFLNMHTLLSKTHRKL